MTHGRCTTSASQSEHPRFCNDFVSMPVQQLFGGAVSLSIPSTYFDVRYHIIRSMARYNFGDSTIRQIPDNQEVWLEKDSDASLIIELVETPTDATDRTAFAT